MQAVTYQDDKPILELAAEEFVFPIMTHDGENLVLFHMRRYEAAEIKRFYSKAAYLPWTNAGFQADEQGEILQFVDRHLVKIGGLGTPEGNEPSLEQQRAWLDQHLEFKSSIFRSGYDGVETHKDQPSDTSRGLLLSVYNQSVKSSWPLYSTERCKSVSIVMTHHLAPFSKSEDQRYWRAFRVIEKNSGDYRLEGDWDVVESLYGQKVKRLEGALFNGRPCDESNKHEWVSAVPFTMKVFVLDEVKNAV